MADLTRLPVAFPRSAAAAPVSNDHVNTQRKVLGSCVGSVQPTFDGSLSLTLTPTGKAETIAEANEENGLTQPRAATTNPFRDLRRAVAADQIVRALANLGFTQRQIAGAAGATDRSVRNWAATGAIRPIFDERLRELSEISLALSDTLSPRGVTQWLSARNRLLDGRRPIDLISKGEISEVRAAAESYVAGDYV